MQLGFGVTFISARLQARVQDTKLDGIGIYTKAIWDALQQEQDVELYPLTFTDKKSLQLTSKFLHSEISATPLPYPLHSGLSAILKRPIGELKKYEQQIDIFFAPDHHIPILHNTPVVATVMDIIPLIHPEWASSRLRSLKNYAFKRAVESATHIITVSQHSKSDILQNFAIEAENISVVPLGVEERFFERVSVEEREQVQKKYQIEREFFLFVGTLQPRKNILRMIDAYMQLPQSIKDETMLVLVGQDGWGSDALQERIDRLITSQSGLWLSYLPQEEIYSLMQSAKAILYPSLYEGFGLPILEGFASQTPLITSNITSMPEVAGDAALLVDPYTIDEITEAMIALFRDEQLCKELVNRGRLRVEQFTWQNSIEKHREVFQLVDAYSSK